MSSYIVLARKWRPQRFEEVAGQTHVTRTLQNALKNNRLAHALLFCGARGVGKTTVARILARAINCPNKAADFNPCNTCDICREIITGASVDIIEIDGASNRGIDEIRQIRENIKFYPARTKFKVYIIDEVHMLTKEAFNALLKTLEEPPSHIYFIMATTEPQKIPQTILSRCQRYDFRKLTLKELTLHLKNIVQKEGMEITDAAITIIAREAGGSVRDSMSILDKVIAFGGALNENDVCDVLGISGFALVREIGLAILNRDIAAAMGVLEKLDSFGVDYNKFLNDLIMLFRDLTIIKRIGHKESLELVDMYPEEVEELFQKIQDISPNHLLLLLTQIMDGIKEISRSPLPKISLEILIIKLCSLEELVSVDELIKKMENMPQGAREISYINQREIKQKKDFSGEIVENKKKPDISENLHTAQSKKDTKKDETFEEPAREPGLRDFINFLRRDNPLIASILMREDIISFAGDGFLEVRPEKDFTADFLTDRENQEKIEEIARKFFKKDIKIRLVNQTSENKEVLSGVTPEISYTNDKIKEAALNDPFVLKAIEVFGAKVLRVEKIENNPENSYIEDHTE